MSNIPQLIEQLTGPDLQKQSDAWKALVAIGAEAVEPLIALLDSPDEQTRMRATSALGQIADARTLEPLLKRLEDSSSRVRQMLPGALVNFKGDSRVVEGLKRLALDRQYDTPAVTRALAAKQLKTVAGDEVAIPVLVELLSFPNAQVASTAAQHLGESNNSTAVEPLIKALNAAQDNNAFRSVVTALSKLHNGRALEPIASYLKSSDVYRRATAAFALGELGDERAVDYLKALSSDKAFAWEEDHGGPKYTVADVANQALGKLKKATGRPWWKPW
ncbi:MAG: HEAT repeat domain-containing protein [Anaerolineae bacterium]|nr:HEAT repeat domain-containing protein [Anaerolineae bacterium]